MPSLEQYGNLIIYIVIFLVSTMAAQQKLELIESDLLPLELVYICDVPHVVGLVVDSMFCCGCLACPLIVAVDIRRCHWTAVAVRPGHPVKW